MVKQHTVMSKNGKHSQIHIRIVNKAIIMLYLEINLNSKWL